MTDGREGNLPNRTQDHSPAPPAPSHFAPAQHRRSQRQVTTAQLVEACGNLETYRDRQGHRQI